MAENVTISAFLELKDDMSSGINRLVSELEQLNDTARQTMNATRAMASAQEQASSRSVVAVHRQRDALAQTGAAANNARSQMQGFASGTADSSQSMAKAVSKGALLADVIMKIASAAKEAAVEFLKSSVELHSYMQTTTANIAQSLKTFNMVPDMSVGLRASKQAMDEIRTAAAALPGETKDYIQIFSLALPKALEAGMRDLSEVTKLTNKYSAVAMGAGIDARQAGMDMYRMLAGQAGADVAMWTRLTGIIKMTTEEFNKMAAPDRMQLLAAAIEQSSQGLASQSTSWAAVFGTFQDMITQIQEAGTEDMFAEVNSLINAANVYLTENKAELIEITQVIGAGIVIGLKSMIGLAILIQKAFSGILYVAGQIKTFVEFIGESAGRLFARISGFLEEADSLTERMDNATAAAERYNEELERGRRQERAHAKAMQDMKRMQKIADENEMRESQRGAEADERQHIKAKEWYASVEKMMGPMKRGVGFTSQETSKLLDLYKKGKVDKQTALEYYKSRDAMGGLSIFEKRLSEIEPKKRRAESTARGPAKHKATPKKEVYDFRYSKFDIRQEFAEGFDPDRIAVAFASDLARLGEMKAAAVYAPLFTGG